eukprot:scaffold6695_cov136-Isochrysis_galbana.AAC.2
MTGQQGREAVRVARRPIRCSPGPGGGRQATRVGRGGAPAGYALPRPPRPRPSGLGRRASACPLVMGRNAPPDLKPWGEDTGAGRGLRVNSRAHAPPGGSQRRQPSARSY